MILFVVEHECTYYLRLCILGFASIAMEDEYTYYVRLYILDQEPFSCVEDEYIYYLRLYILGFASFCHGR